MSTLRVLGRTAFGKAFWPWVGAAAAVPLGIGAAAVAPAAFRVVGNLYLASQGLKAVRIMDLERLKQTLRDIDEGRVGGAPRELRRLRREVLGRISELEARF